MSHDNHTKTESRTLLDIIDELNQRVRWSSGVLDLLSESTVLEAPDVNAVGAARAHLEDAQKLVDELADLRRTMGQPELLGAQEAQEEAAEVDEGESIPRNRLSGGTPYDDAALILERIGDLAKEINVKVVNGRADELSSTLTHLLVMEIEYMETALRTLDRTTTAKTFVEEVQRRRPAGSGEALDAIEAAAVLVQAIFCGTNGKPEIPLRDDVPALCNMIHERLNRAKTALEAGCTQEGEA